MHIDKEDLKLIQRVLSNRKPPTESIYIAIDAVNRALAQDKKCNVGDVGVVSLEYMNEQVMAEREACARLCKQIAKKSSDHTFPKALECADAILSRGLP